MEPPGRSSRPGAPSSSHAGSVRPSGSGSAGISVDVCLLFDATESMKDHLRAAVSFGEKIASFTSGVREHGQGIIGVVRYAAVAYRDFGDIHVPQIERLDFTPDIGTLNSFLRRLVATGGGVDYCEDVAGGYAAAAGLSWTPGTRSDSIKILAHFLDAPPHFAAYHDLGAPNDQFWAASRTPDGASPESLLESLRKLAALEVAVNCFRVSGSRPHLLKMEDVLAPVYRSVPGNGYEMQWVDLGAFDERVFVQCFVGTVRATIVTRLAQTGHRGTTAPKLEDVVAVGDLRSHPEVVGVAPSPGASGTVRLGASAGVPMSSSRVSVAPHNLSSNTSGHVGRGLPPGSSAAGSGGGYTAAPTPTPQAPLPHASKVLPGASSGGPRGQR